MRFSRSALKQAADFRYMEDEMATGENSPMPDRRIQSDRRSRTERRRRRRGKRRTPDANEALVVEITNRDLAVLRLQRTDGDAPDDVFGSTLPWRREATSLVSEEGRKELAAAMCELARQHPHFNGALHLVLGGEFCVTRAIRGTSEEVRRELQGLKDRSRLYLSLGPGEKVVVTSIRSIDARHDHALAAICNQETLHAILDAADAAGLRIDTIEPALSAACRAASRLADLPDEACLLIHLDAPSPEIGVFRGSDLALDYRPGGQRGATDLAALLEKHLNRLRRHARRRLGDASARLARVYLCGAESCVAAAMEDFRDSKKFEVKRIDPGKVQGTWQLDYDARRLATIPALGALLSAYQRSEDRHSPNLLDQMLASSQEPLRPELIKLMLPLAATLLIAVGMATINFSAQKKVVQAQADLAKIAPLRLQATALLDEIIAKQEKFRQLGQLAGQIRRPFGDDLIAAIGQCMPSDVWLSGVQITDGDAIDLTGAGFHDAGVYDFVGWLEQAPRVDNVVLQSTSPGQSPAGNVTQFHMQLTAGGGREGENGRPQP